MQKKISYGREEKLKSRKLIEMLFSKGRSFSIFPLHIKYIEVKETLDFAIKAGVGASSKNFKKAAERNRIKRLLREAYRTEKQSLHEYVKLHNKQVAVFISYIDKVMPGYNILKLKMPLALQRLMKELNEKNSANT